MLHNIRSDAVLFDKDVFQSTKTAHAAVALIGNFLAYALERRLDRGSSGLRWFCSEGRVPSSLEVSLEDVDNDNGLEKLDPERYRERSIYFSNLSCD